VMNSLLLIRLAGCIAGLQINHELEFVGPYHRQFARLFASEDPRSILASLAISQFR